jgi:hypothetical protein
MPMLQRTLLRNPVDEFFWELEEPPESYRETITEELYSVAVKSRLYVDDDHESYDYQAGQEQEATMSETTSDFRKGQIAGQNNDVPALLANRKNDSFCLGYAVGREQELAKHHDTTSIIFESPNQCNFARRGRVGA